VDGDIIDDVSLNQEHQMIDNNEFVTSTALHLTPDSSNNAKEQSNLFEAPEDSFEVVHKTDLLSVLEDLEVTSYLLLVKGVPICSGPKEEIEEQVDSLVFGQHELCDGEPISENDIMVFNKLSIKVGVTLG
jgi:hypothetical protein